MANLQYGDKVKFTTSPQRINGILDVAPIRFDTLEEDWVVCEQKKATHMLVAMDISDRYDGLRTTEYMMIEIGKCDNLYLLADAIVD